MELKRYKEALDDYNYILNIEKDAFNFLKRSIVNYQLENFHDSVNINFIIRYWITGYQLKKIKILLMGCLLK
jgi:hypothetical protein